MKDVETSSLLPTLLLVLFIGLKLTGHIAWSWWWVMSPLWIPFVIVLVITPVILVIVWIAGGFK